jgi:hypothetical protein
MLPMSQAVTSAVDPASGHRRQGRVRRVGKPPRPRPGAGQQVITRQGSCLRLARVWMSFLERKLIRESRPQVRYPAGARVVTREERAADEPGIAALDEM